MTKKSLHLIGNAHLDLVWLWPWQEGFQEVKATFRSALDRMNEFEDFIFTSSSSVMYEWLEEHDPHLFAEIKHRVTEGRWVLCGGWYVQPDCNLPSGESFVRQALYGQLYFQEKFGVTAKVGYNVDSFGHHAMLPQLLKKSGIDYYVFMRPGPTEKQHPGRIFHWKSADGSEVLAYQIPDSYDSHDHTLEQKLVRAIEEMEAGSSELMAFYGIGNHGGGPTKKSLQLLEKMMEERPNGPLLFSSPNDFFADVQQQVASGMISYPVVEDELQYHAPGCYAVHSLIKRYNRTSEQAIITAEKFATIAMAKNLQAYPSDYDRAWKNILFNQFHDILAGTSLESTYEDALMMYGESKTIAARGLNNALQSLSWNIHIEQEEGMKPIVVFNPHSWQVERNIEVEFSYGEPFHTDRWETDVRIVDVNGDEVNFQYVQSQSATSFRRRLSWIARIPAFGYSVYRIVVGTPRQAEKLRISTTSMENDFIRLQFDPQTGYITSLFDKQLQTEVFGDAAAKPVVIDDETDSWGHQYDGKKLMLNSIIGSFLVEDIKVLEHGSIKGVVQISSRYGSSKLVQRFTLYRHSKQVDVQVMVDWHEKCKALKLQFPVLVNEGKATYEIPYGHIMRPCNGVEEFGHSWFDLTGNHLVTGDSYGLSILNDGKYSFDVNGQTMGLTVLRSSVYAHQDPLKIPEEHYYNYIDQGIQHFSYSLLPHHGDWKEAATVKRAAEFNQPLLPLPETYHNGHLPQLDSYISVEQNNLIVQVLKKAERSDDYIVRVYETDHLATEGVVKILNRVITANWGPSEIKSFRVPQDRSKAIIEISFLEDEV